MTVGEWLHERVVWADDTAAAPGETIRLVAGRCSACDRHTFPATGSCTWCGSATEDAPLVGPGRVVAATDVLHRTPSAVVGPPYVVALARFDSIGLDLLGRVLGVADSEVLGVDTPVSVVGDELPDGRRHFAFAVAEEADA